MPLGPVDFTPPSLATHWSPGASDARDGVTPDVKPTPRAEPTVQGESTAELRKRLLKLIVASEKSRRGESQPQR